MSQQSNPVAPSTSPSLSRLPFCGPPPLLKGENAADYDDLLARVSGHLKPSDIFEENGSARSSISIWRGRRWRRNLARVLDAAPAEGTRGSPPAAVAWSAERGARGRVS